MKRILLPTDFSDNSINAMNYAMKFFAGTSCTYYVLNIQKYSEYISGELMTAAPGESVHDAIAADNKAQLLKLVSNFREKYKQEQYEFEALFDYDVFIDSINQTIGLQKIDLIVMGTNGASGAKEVVFGSNTLQVIRNVKCPVLAIPEQYEYNKIDNILYSMEKDHYPDVETQDLLIEILGKHRPKFHLLSLNEDAIDDTLLDKTKVFAHREVNFHSLSGLPVPMAIKAFVSLMKVDMHALSVRKQSFLDRFIHGSNTSKISYGTQVPLFIFKR